MGLDDTYTDLEFKKRIEANKNWMGQFARREPDLVVEQFTSLLSRFLRLFSTQRS